MTARYAIYFAPPAETPLARFGAAWLGRCAETGARLARRAVEGFGADRLERITEVPRGYGFHATLAPPMRLEEGCTPSLLDEALAAFARVRAPFRAPPLKLAAMDGFLALVLAGESEAMQELEDDVIHTFHRFRAPPEPAAYIRPRAATLTPREEALLRQSVQGWGYPYARPLAQLDDLRRGVLEAFRFHMTLTGELEPPERSALPEGTFSQDRSFAIDDADVVGLRAPVDPREVLKSSHGIPSDLL